MKFLLTAIWILTLTILLHLQLNAQGSWIRNETKIETAVEQYDLSGEGTVIVMIDRGIDYRHPDFIDDMGKTRIAYIYDMTNSAGAGDADNSYAIGTIWDESEINMALSNNTNPPLTNDNGGHGTATTGIICGDGSGTVSREFKGVAPKAKIISIKFIQDGFPPFGSNPGEVGFFNIENLDEALQFAQDKIDELGLPSVTLMNFGSIGGPSDGTSLVSRQMDDYIALGHPLVCGVGDDGGNENRAASALSQGQTIEIEINKVSSSIRFDLWYEELDRFDVSVKRPNGTIAGPYTAPATANDVNDQFLGDINIYHRGANVEFFQATSARREILIDISGATGVFKIILEAKTVNGSGDFIATLNPAAYFGANAFLNYIAPQGSIHDYASAVNVISPSDYVVDNTWTDINGVPRSKMNQGNPGEIWIGSSEGPTQDGRLGIDFAAPGEVCIGAYSMDSYYGNFAFNNIQNGNGYYGIQNAVSASAPVTVGVIALMLEANPSLTHQEIKSILQSTAIADNFTQAVPNNTWGYGKLNALEAIRASLRQSSDIIISEDGIEISERTNSGKYLVRGDFQNYDVMLLDPLGNIITDYSSHTANVLEIDLSGIPSGQRFIKVEHTTDSDLFVIQRID